MTVTTSYPGVYINEIEPAAPIQGVGTSTAAFIGPTAMGEINEPTMITSWTQFTQTFGSQPLPGFYLWYAVRGFFDNGGLTCYVIRASNGAYASASIDDASGEDVLDFTALQPGTPTITITVTNPASLLTNTQLYTPSSTLAAASTPLTITVASTTDAAQFRPGDYITLGALNERAQIVQIGGAVIRLAAPLLNSYASGTTVRLADAIAGTLTVRLISTNPSLGSALPSGVLVPGSMLTITQGATTDTQIVNTVQAEYVNATTVTYRVTFRMGLDSSFSLSGSTAATVVSDEFTITVADGSLNMVYPNLAIDPAHPRYVIDIINSDPNTVVSVAAHTPPPSATMPANLPAAGGPFSLINGAVESLSTINSINYLAALASLDQIKDVNLIAIPDGVRNPVDQAPVQQGLITHCELHGDRFAVLDSVYGLPLYTPASPAPVTGPATIEIQRAGLDSARGYAALYYPWVQVQPLTTGAPVFVPSSGHICGIIAQTDNTRGVYKAPANVVVAGVLGIENIVSDVDQGILNMAGINVTRVFATGAQPVLFGARTTSPDPNWTYVSTRRLFIYLEQSIEVALQASVFEPNNEFLWKGLTRTITNFLTTTWRNGWLFGDTAADAFYVEIDEENNPFSEQALGRLHIEIGCRPTFPAEFIIIDMAIWPGGSEISES
jgi:hypothetical protein